MAMSTGFVEEFGSFVDAYRRALGAGAEIPQSKAEALLALELAQTQAHDAGGSSKRILECSVALQQINDDAYLRGVSALVAARTCVGDTGRTACESGGEKALSLSRKANELAGRPTSMSAMFAAVGRLDLNGSQAVGTLSPESMRAAIHFAAQIQSEVAQAKAESRNIRSVDLGYDHAYESGGIKQRAVVYGEFSGDPKAALELLASNDAAMRAAINAELKGSGIEVLSTARTSRTVGHGTEIEPYCAYVRLVSVAPIAPTQPKSREQEMLEANVRAVARALKDRAGDSGVVTEVRFAVEGERCVVISVAAKDVAFLRELLAESIDDLSGRLQPQSDGHLRYSDDGWLKDGLPVRIEVT